MTIPAFTAEASLYKASGHNRTARYTVGPNARINPVRPAVREQEGEVINVHSCPPGTDYGGTCFPPPSTEPPVDGGGADGWPPEGPSDGGGVPTDTGTKPKPAHFCDKSDFGGSITKSANAQADCFKWGLDTGGPAGHAWCVPTKQGKLWKWCCVTRSNGLTECVNYDRVPHLSDFPTKKGL
jgi:hypothetical protein